VRLRRSVEQIGASAEHGKETADYAAHQKAIRKAVVPRPPAGGIAAARDSAVKLVDEVKFRRIVTADAQIRDAFRCDTEVS
jgi:hypothetical protein